jgi:hypothetical protein
MLALSQQGQIEMPPAEISQLFGSSMIVMNLHVQLLKDLIKRYGEGERREVWRKLCNNLCRRGREEDVGQNLGRGEEGKEGRLGSVKWDIRFSQLIFLRLKEWEQDTSTISDVLSSLVRFFFSPSCVPPICPFICFDELSLF